MLYLFLFIAISLTIISFHNSKNRERHPLWSNFKLDRMLGTNSATVFWATSILIAIIMLILDSEPGETKTKHQRLENERVAQKALGHYFGKRFSHLAQGESKVLIIDNAGHEAGRNYHGAFVEGFESGIFRHISGIKEEFVGLENKESENGENTFNVDLHIDAEKIDELVTKNEECKIVILLTDLPRNFIGSKTWIKVNHRELLLGIVTSNVYNKGGMIFESEISVCAVPRTLYNYDKSYLNTNLEEVFALRYIDINPENVAEMLKKHRQLFQPSNSR